MTKEETRNGEARDYLAYLLRLWRETGGGSSQWHASLQDPHTGKRAGFGSLEELFAHLQRETEDLWKGNGERLAGRRQDR
jgi:hypothetical protein